MGDVLLRNVPQDAACGLELVIAIDVFSSGKRLASLLQGIQVDPNVSFKV